MPSRVTPNEAIAHLDQEMATSSQPSTNDASFVVNIQEQENVNEQLLKEIDEVYSPVLKLMKLFGIYFGDASLRRCLAHTPGRRHKLSVLPRIYCGVVISGFCLNVIMAFSGIFLENDIYFFLMASFWNLLVALNATLSLVLFRLTGTKKSRFKNFLVSVSSVVKDVKLAKVKAQAKQCLIVFCVFVITFQASLVVIELLQPINLGNYKPWNDWFGFKVLSMIFQIIGLGVWLLPILFYCITCLTLREFVDCLHKRTTPRLDWISIDIAALKMEYHKLCEVIELADKMLAPLLLVFVSVYIPLLCFSFSQVVILREEDTLFFLLGNLGWLLAAASILAVILMFGSNFSEKINGFQKILQTSTFSTADEAKLVMFLLDLQGDPKGLSIGGLVVITKSMSLTIVGVIISYFAVMLSLPK
ncbi:uncharacterized protein LOC144655178 isoform X1 [Oculina patagonica]